MRNLQPDFAVAEIVTCHDCGEHVTAALELVHRCDPALAIAHLREQRADLILVNQRLTDLGLAQSRYWMGHVTKAALAVFEARDLAWELWVPPTPGANDREIKATFDKWRQEGWKPKSERKDDGESKSEEPRG